MKTDILYREGIIINDFRSDNIRVSDIYHSNKIYKVTLNKGECIGNTVINNCCVDTSGYESITDKINALKIYENNLKIDVCKKYLLENKDNPFASRMTQTKKEMASYKKQNRELGSNNGKI